MPLASAESGLDLLL